MGRESIFTRGKNQGRHRETLQTFTGSKNQEKRRETNGRIPSGYISQGKLSRGHYDM